MIAAAMERSAGLVLAVFEGPRTDPDLARLAEQMTAQRSATAGWAVDVLATMASLNAEGVESPPSAAAGPLLWIRSDDLHPTLDRVAEHGGTVHGRPRLDGGERWLVEVDDPAGNRIGAVVMARHPQSQTMIVVREVEASSGWYQQLLGLRSDHGGPDYERLLAGDTLVLQLHHRDGEAHEPG